jgi:copper oxidase (laccase) domain-containing protein
MSAQYRHISVFAPFSELLAIETTRHGGVSAAPYASLNLGTNTQDSPQNVAQNRQLLFDAIGIEHQQFAASTRYTAAVFCTPPRAVLLRATTHSSPTNQTYLWVLR